jgi:hypothetical protein
VFCGLPHEFLSYCKSYVYILQYENNLYTDVKFNFIIDTTEVINCSPNNHLLNFEDLYVLKLFKLI